MGEVKWAYLARFRPKWPILAGIIDRLRLAAQHHVVHHRFMRRALGAGQDAVEGAGLHHLALGEIDVQGAQEVGEGEQLFLRRRVVHAVDQRRALAFSSASAAATLASTMNSSISFMDSSRSR